jgi:hypothetical protein
MFFMKPVEHEPRSETQLFSNLTQRIALVPKSFHPFIDRFGSHHKSSNPFRFGFDLRVGFAYPRCFVIYL